MTNIFVFEGADGSGKDYLMNIVYERLKSDGISTVIVPKSVYHDSEVDKMAIMTGNGNLAVLNHIEKILTRKIDYLSKLDEKPEIALISRWYPSTYVYQYYISGKFDESEFMKAYEIVCHRLDKSIKLRRMKLAGFIWRDTPSRKSAERIKHNNLYDRIALYMPEKIKEGYRIYFNSILETNNVLRIKSADLTEEDITYTVEFIKAYANIRESLLKG